MSTRLVVVAGLLSGALAATGLLVGLIVLGPAPGLAGASRPPAAEPPGSAPSATAVPGRLAPSAAASAPIRSTGALPAVSGGPSTSPATENFHVGEAAPPLDVPRLGGGEIELAALRGSAVWINFMATWCTSCVDEFPLMNGFAARYADEGLTVVAVDVREDEAAVAAFVEDLGGIFPVGLDTDGRAQDAWAAYALPVHFWVDREGIVRFGSFGGIGPDVMARGVSQVLPGVEVTP